MAESDLSNDPIIERVRATLLRTPKVEPSDVARILVAVNSRRAARTWRQRTADRLWFMRIPSVSLVGVGAVGTAALLLGFLGRGVFERGTIGDARIAAGDAVNVTRVTAPVTQQELTRTDASAMDEQAVPVQFVLSQPGAGTVSLVGDFNGWDVSAAVLEQVPGSSLWSATVNLKPGRHVYAFVVDGNKWMRDPRAPEAIDEDFGRPQSVIVVQVPWSGR